MATEMTNWTERGLGTMPGLGNDRPRGGAEVKMELEPGLAVVRYLYDNSRVDQQWSMLDDRGYTWWADGLAQRVWAEPAFDDDVIEISRVFVETDVLRDISDADAAARAVDSMNELAAGSALVVDPDAGTVRSVASMWVHEQVLEMVARSLSVIGAVQVGLAERQATILAPEIDGERAVTSHPESGARPEPDEMLGVLQLVCMDGQAGSGWVGDEMESVLEQIRRLPVVTLATGDADGLTLEVPYDGATALIQLDTDWEHPSLGSGLVARLSLPGVGSPGAAWAAARNRQELEALTRSHFVGNWIGSAPFPTFVSFYPNMLARTGLSAVNIALSLIGRARWMAEAGA